MIDTISALIKEINKAETVYKSPASWELKYTLILNHHHSNSTRPLVRSLGLTLGYWNSGKTYMEETKAYMEALLALRDDLKDAIGTS